MLAETESEGPSIRWGSSMRLLLIEDDEMIGAAVRSGLREERLRRRWIQDGAAAERACAESRYAAAILDLGLRRARMGSRCLPICGAPVARYR